MDEKLKQDKLNKLSRVSYEVTQNSCTEKPFSSIYNDFYKDGIYVDIVSGEVLFSSLDKFDSGCGWPSFSKPLEDNIKENEDFEKDQTILFSPATSSFCQFRSFEHRGKVFKELTVKILGN